MNGLDVLILRGAPGVGKSTLGRGLRRQLDHGSVIEVDDIRGMLARVDLAKSADDMNVPGWRLHLLSGNLDGYFSVWVNGNWRMIFTFEDGDAVLVDYQDYH